MDWQTAISNKQIQAPAHILIYVNNQEYAEQIPHVPGSGEIKFDSSTGLYSVQSTDGKQQSQRDDLAEQDVPQALEELGITNSTWV